MQFQVTSISAAASDPSALNTIRLLQADNADWNEDLLTKQNSGKGGEITLGAYDAIFLIKE